MNTSLRQRTFTQATCRRVFPLDDISIRSGGDGRTVEAYAAVFDIEATISDFEGIGYREVIRKGTFLRSIQQRLDRWQVIFNHGMDMWGNPSERFTMPLGVPIEVREDNRGLWTVTRYSKTPLADEVLTLIVDGAIRAQSFQCDWIRSSVRAPFRRGQLVERQEAAVKEYGPAPFAQYMEAEIVGIRSASTLVDEIVGMTAGERAELARLLTLGTLIDPADPGTDDGDPPVTGKDPEPVKATTPPDQTIELEHELAQYAMRLT